MEDTKYVLEECESIAKNMADLQSRSKDVADYIALSKDFEKAKKSARPELVKMRADGEIDSNAKQNFEYVSLLFKEIESVVRDDDGSTKLTKAQIQAIAQLCPDLVASVITPAVIDGAITAASGKRTDAAKAIQTINRSKTVRTTYQAIIGEVRH